jgi:penicillin-binding protein 1A
MPEKRTQSNFPEKRDALSQWMEKTGAAWRRCREWLARNPRVAMAGKLLAGAFAAGIVFLLLLAVLVYYGAFGRLPTYNDLRAIRNHTASEVYAEDGVLLGKYYVQNRINADFEEISPHVIHALIATEDARFFEHRGIDARAVMRVIIKSILLFDDSAGGGSTLSQQLAKNLFPREKTGLLSVPVAKFREMFVARRLEQLYTKEELLNLYLNTVPFGENVYGIKVAAHRFFGKSPDRLKIHEAALLVGILKANTYYNPVRNPERALQRRNTVIGQLVKYGYIEEEEGNALKSLPLELNYQPEGNNQGLATYFREHLRQELESTLKKYKKPDGSSYNLYTDGLKIYTTIHSRMQRYAEEAVREHLSRLQDAFVKQWGKDAPWNDEDMLVAALRQSPRYQRLKERGLPEEQIRQIFETPVSMTVFDWEKGQVDRTMSPLDSVRHHLALLNTGFLAAEPGTGLVRAWVGGISHRFFQYDHVKSRRQVGSTIKPVVFAAALSNGMLPCEYTINELRTYPEYKNWQPRNADGEYGGAYSMEGALAHSINTVTVEIMRRAGLDKVRALARQMGVEGTIPNEAAISLGALEASLWEMTSVYGAFANRGLRPEWHYLDRIETADGRLIAEFERPDSRRFSRVLESDQAELMVRMMQSVVDSGTARRLKYEFKVAGPIAGKTGTTQKQTDGWFVGFTPTLVAGAWIGADNPQVRFRSMRLGQGSSSALPIWGRFMRKVQQDPDLKAWRGGRLPMPSDTLLDWMKCPQFLPEMPIIADLMEEYYRNPAFFQQMYTDLAEEREREIQIQLKRRRNNETEEEYYERMLRYNERLIKREERREENREKLKEFWSEKLFGNKIKEGKGND